MPLKAMSASKNIDPSRDSVADETMSRAFSSGGGTGEVISCSPSGRATR